MVLTKPGVHSTALRISTAQHSTAHHTIAQHRTPISFFIIRKLFIDHSSQVKGGCMGVLKGHTSRVCAVAWHPSGHQLASASEVSRAGVFLTNRQPFAAAYVIVLAYVGSFHLVVRFVVC